MSNIGQSGQFLITFCVPAVNEYRFGSLSIVAQHSLFQGLQNSCVKSSSHVAKGTFRTSWIGELLFR